MAPHRSIQIARYGTAPHRTACRGINTAGNRPSILTLTKFVLDRSCSVKSPKNGNMGNCSSTLAHDTNCAPKCDQGYHLSPPASCDSGTLTAPKCPSNQCRRTAVANSDYAAPNSLKGRTAETISVKCSAGFAGSGVVTCQASGVFSDLSCTVCPARYSLPA